MTIVKGQGCIISQCISLLSGTNFCDSLVFKLASYPEIFNTSTKTDNSVYLFLILTLIVTVLLKESLTTHKLCKD